MGLWDANSRAKQAPAKVRTDAVETGQTVIALPSLGRVLEKELEAPSGDRHFKIRLAGIRRLKSDANGIVKRRYAWRGYGTNDPIEAPHRLTIIAYDREEAVGTLTVGLDSAKGLRCDDLYKTELDSLRSSGRQLCEFVKLAVNPNSTSLNTLASLFHVAFLYACKIRGYDDVVIEVNPRHVGFYRRALGFERLGEERMNGHVQAPAVLMHRDFDYIDVQLKRFGGKAELRGKEKSLFPYGFSPSEARGILRRLEAIDLVPA